MLDFKELPKNGDDFELLIREILYNKGLEVYWSGKGQDGGKDLLCIEILKSNFKPSNKRWLIQCKHNAHSSKSVGISDLDDIIDSCAEHNASGYMLVCSTYPSSTVVKRLENIQNNKGITTTFWDYRFLERELLKPENWSLVNMFLPKSFAEYGWRISAIEPYFWHASYDGFIFYIATRIGTNCDYYLNDISDRINELKSKKLPDGHIVRLRGVYFDDKYTNYYLYIDYLIPKGMDENEEYLEDTVEEEIVDDIIEGVSYQYDIMTYRYWPHSDNFDRDHIEYYNNYLDVFKYGGQRERSKNNIYSKRESTREITEELVNQSYDALIEVFNKISFISVLNSWNSRIEFVDQFSSNFSWINMVREAEYGMDNIFNVIIRFTCYDFEKMVSLLERFPQEVMMHFELDKNYVFLPDEGLAKSEEIYSLTFRVHPIMITTKLNYRVFLNKYIDELTSIIKIFIEE